jgi:colanic acid/amylovoran biosynthesis glycosyltransferase
MGRLQILIVAPWYPTVEDPSAGIFIRDQAWAVALRHDVTVLVPPDAASRESTSGDGVQVLRLPPARGDGKRANIERLRAISRAVAGLARAGRPPALIHAHTFSAGALAAPLGWRWRLPVVVTEHHSDLIEDLVRGWDARVARFAYSRADLVCPVSEPLERAILRLEPRARCEVVDNVVDIDAFSRVNGAARERAGGRVLVVAGLARQKGYPDLFEALRLLLADRPEVTLEVIGDGPDRAACESLAAGLPVVFRGACERAEVANRMHATDLLVMPSLVESFGIAAIEGLAAGLPVVVTSVVPVADVVLAHGGVVVPSGNPQALRYAMAAMLARPASGPDRDGARNLRSRFGPEVVAAHWDSIYRRLAALRGEQKAPR